MPIETSDEAKSRIAKKIRSLRYRLGMNQADFAEALGMPGGQSLVSRWEKGKVVPSMKTLMKLEDLGQEDDPTYELLQDAQDVLVAENRPLSGYEPSPDGSPAEQLIYYFTVPETMRTVVKRAGVRAIISLAYTTALDDGWPEEEIRKLDAWRRDLLGPDAEDVD